MTIGYALRFSVNCKERDPLSRIKGKITVAELKLAEQALIRLVQREWPRDAEFHRLELQLRMFEDSEGNMRSKGRLDYAGMDFEMECPIVLPRTHHVTKLIIEEAQHCGQGDTIAKIREKYTMHRMRQLVRSILFNCHVCRRNEGKSYKSLPIAPLPSFRAKMEEPFSTTGTDFAGPLKIRDGKDMATVYILLFTCTATRAIHLELLADKKAPTFIKGTRRFVARRGAPKLVVSDNDKTFRASETMQFLRDRGIEWKFNIPEAPWTGGVFERMVKATKRCLRKTLGKSSLTFDELNTLLTEIENTLNNRPLSYIEDDTTISPLTPNHLIYGRRVSMFNDEEILNGMKIQGPTQSLPKKVRHRQKMLIHFQNRCRKEYLLQLRQHTKAKRYKDRQVSIGDVVLVEDQSKRVNRRMGRFVGLIKSKDGEARSARVKVSTKPRQHEVLERRIEKLYPLELAQCDGSKVSGSDAR
jgi:hypothetical protein